MFKPSMTGAWSDRTEDLRQFIDIKVRDWLNDRIRGLLLDYLNIKYVSKGSAVGGLHDYSYLIMPAFKALEGTMLHIGLKLGFDIEKYQYKTGRIFSEENLEKYYADVLDKITTLDEEKRLDIKQWLDNVRRILKSLRHNPAHYNGEWKTFEKAFLDGDMILSTINYMCLALIESKIFENSQTN